MKNSLFIIGVLDREEKEKGSESIFKEMMAEKSPNLSKYLDTFIKLTDYPKI